jgi:hypothetical protein
VVVKRKGNSGWVSVVIPFLSMAVVVVVFFNPIGGLPAGRPAGAPL